MEAIEFGQAVAKRRHELGLTQRQLAEMLHVSDKAVSKWECGRGFPEFSIIGPLAKALDIPASSLICAPSSSGQDNVVSYETPNHSFTASEAESSTSLLDGDDSQRGRLAGVPWRDALAPAVLAGVAYSSLSRSPYNIAGLVLGYERRWLFMLAMTATSYLLFAMIHLELRRGVTPALMILRFAMATLLCLIGSGLPLLITNLENGETVSVFIVALVYSIWALLAALLYRHSLFADVDRPVRFRSDMKGAQGV